jgi:hypothetical protein
MRLRVRAPRSGFVMCFGVSSLATAPIRPEESFVKEGFPHPVGVGGCPECVALRSFTVEYVQGSSHGRLDLFVVIESVVQVFYESCAPFLLVSALQHVVVGILALASRT